MPGRVNSASMPSSASPFLSVSFQALASALMAFSSSHPGSLGCHGTRYVRHARGWCAYGRAPGQAALRLWYVRYAGGWYARTYSTEAPGRTCQQSWLPELVVVHPGVEALEAVRQAEERVELARRRRLLERLLDCARHAQDHRVAVGCAEHGKAAVLVRFLLVRLPAGGERVPRLQSRVARIVDDDVSQPGDLICGVLCLVILLLLIIVIVVVILTLDAHYQHRALTVVLLQRRLQSRKVGLLRLERRSGWLLLLGGRHVSGARASWLAGRQDGTRKLPTHSLRLAAAPVRFTGELGFHRRSRVAAFLSTAAERGPAAQRQP